MAFFTTHIDRSAAENGIFNRLAAYLITRMTARTDQLARLDQIAALAAKPDDDLARMGLSRNEIPYFVFRDRFFA